jgi:MFS family permease
MFSVPPLLRDRAFALVWLVEVIAISAGHISYLALPIVGTTMLHASPAQMGLLVAFQALPFALLSLPAGVWVDRTSKVKLLVWTFVSLIFALAVLPVTYWTGTLSMPVLYAVGFAIGCVMTMFGTAHQVLVTHIVGRPRLVDAYRIISTSESLIRLAAPAVAGLLIEWMGAPRAVTIEVIALVFACALFAQIKEPASAKGQPAKAGGPGMLADIREGLRYCWRDPALRAMAIVAAVWQLLFHGFLAMQVLFATRILNMSAGQIGVVHIAGGIGALVAAVLVKRLNERHGAGPVMVAGLMLTTVVWLGFAVIPAPYPFNMAGMGLMLFFFDLGAIAFFINYISMRQIMTPDALLGRVTATMRWAAVSGAPVGALLTGLLAELVGLRWTFATLGVLGMTATICLALYKPFRDASTQALHHAPTLPATLPAREAGAGQPQGAI